MSKKRVLLGLSGGKDSAWFAYYLQNKGYDVSAITVNTGFLSPLALPNALAVAERLSMKHWVISDNLPQFVEIYRDGFKRLRESYDPIVHICHQCAGVVHSVIEEHAECHKCPLIAIGITDEDFSTYSIPDGAFSEVLRPPEIGEDKVRGYLDELKILPWRRSDPIRTNCLINWLMIDCCLKWYGRHPYEDLFPKRKLVKRAVRAASKLGLLRPRLLKRLRSQLLE